MNWECAHAHMHFTRSACLSGWRSAACAQCVTNPSSGSTQTPPRVQRVQWTLRRCEEAGKEETGLSLKKTYTLNTLGMMDSGHLKDISQEMLIMIPKWPPCCWPLSNMPWWELDNDSTKMIWSDQTDRERGGWIGSFHKKIKKIILVLLPYCTVHQKHDRKKEPP